MVSVPIKPRFLALAVAATALGFLTACAGCATPSGNVSAAKVGPFTGLAFGKAWRLGEDRLAVLADDHYVYIYNVRDKRKPLLVSSCPCPHAAFWALAAVTEDRLAWDCHDRSTNRYEFQIADAASGKVLYRFPLESDRYSCTAIARNEAKGLVAWIEDPGVLPRQGASPVSIRIRMADINSGQLLLDEKIQKLDVYQGDFKALAISPDASTVVFSCNRGVHSTGVLDVKAKEVLWHIKVLWENGKVVEETSVGANAIVYDLDGKSFFADGAYVRRIDTLTGRVLSKWGPVTYKGFAAIDGVIVDPFHVMTDTASLLAMDLSPDGKYIAVDTDGVCGTVIFDTATGKEFRRINSTQWPVDYPLFFSADSKGIWVAGSQDKELKYFKVAD